MNILRRIRWDYLIVYLLMFAGCVAFWYFVILAKKRVEVNNYYSILIIFIKSVLNFTNTAKVVPRCNQMARLKACSGEIPKKLDVIIKVCPEDEIGSHSNNP